MTLLVDSNAYDFPSLPGMPMTNQTCVQWLHVIPHWDNFAWFDMLWRSVLLAQVQGTGFEEQGSSKEKMLEEIEESWPP